MLRCPNCSAPIDGKAQACDYCSADFAGLEKHAEVEWPLRAPEAEALVALDLRCPSELPLDPVRKVLEDLFVALVVELGPGMSLKGVEFQLRRRLNERLDSRYQLQALRVTAFTPVWRGGKTERQAPLFQAKRQGPTSTPTPVHNGVREELVKRRRVHRPPPEPVDLGPMLLHVGLTLALAAIMGVAIVIGVWVSHHLMLTILLTLGAVATAAIVWGVRRDQRRKRTWEAFVEQKRATRSGAGAVAPPVSKRAASPAEAPAPDARPVELSAPPDEPSTSKVKLSAPKARER